MRVRVRNISRRRGGSEGIRFDSSEEDESWWIEAEWRDVNCGVCKSKARNWRRYGCLEYVYRIGLDWGSNACVGCVD